MMNANSHFGTLRHSLIMYSLVLGAGLNCFKSKLVISAHY